MKKLAFVVAGAYLAVSLGTVTVARAHSTQQCKEELKTYASMCKFSPTAFILGFCKNKKAQQWCTDRKLHDEKFHK